jgi:2-C-methyl-D-erythritol 4-phosphate cytidylyltransferase
MPSRTTYAIIPAGGIGKRMQSQNPKQFLTLFDEPILLHTVKALAKTNLISKFIIPTIDIVYTKKILNHIKDDLDIQICKAGKFRQESIYNALQEIIKTNDLPEFILIHDAVRANVKKDIVINVINKAKEKGAAVAARPVTDTLKLSHLDESGDVLIKKNVSRDLLWQTQTPQVFATDILLEAYEQAKKDHFLGTDSAGLVERINKDVYLVESPQSNLKITTPEDLELMKHYLKLEKESN